MTSVDQKPLTTDQANEFAKRQVRVDIGRQGAEAISKSALADAKFEGDYARIMTALRRRRTPASDGAGAAWRTGAGDRGRPAGDRDSRAAKAKRSSRRTDRLRLRRRSGVRLAAGRRQVETNQSHGQPLCRRAGRLAACERTTSGAPAVRRRARPRSPLTRSSWTSAACARIAGAGGSARRQSIPINFPRGLALRRSGKALFSRLSRVDNIVS